MVIEMVVDRDKFQAVIVYIPKEWKSLIHERVNQLYHRSVSEYIRSLIREDLVKSGLLK